MIKTTPILIAELPNYVNPKAKIGRMVDAGELFPVIRGIYETDSKTPAKYLAGCVYGPSYISFEYALDFYGLTNTHTKEITCATFGKRKEKIHETMFGTFAYRDVPKTAYSLGLELHVENGYSFIMASPEKALCDELYKSRPAKNKGDLKTLLFDEIGVGKRKINRLDMDLIFELADCYGCKNLHLLKMLLRKKHESDH